MSASIFGDCGRLTVTSGKSAHYTTLSALETLKLLRLTASVTETGIALGIEEVLHVEAQVGDRLLVLLLEAQVEQSIVQGSAEQELERQIVDSLGRLLSVVDWRAALAKYSGSEPLHLLWVSFQSIAGEEIVSEIKRRLQRATSDESVSSRKGDSLIGTDGVQVEGSPGKRGLDVLQQYRRSAKHSNKHVNTN